MVDFGSDSERIMRLKKEAFCCQLHREGEGAVSICLWNGRELAIYQEGEKGGSPDERGSWSPDSRLCAIVTEGMEIEHFALCRSLAAPTCPGMLPLAVRSAGPGFHSGKAEVERGKARSTPWGQVITMWCA